MSAAAPATFRMPRWTDLLNLFLAGILWMLGGLAWLGLQLAGDRGAARSGHLRVIVDVNDPDEGLIKLNLRVPLRLLHVGVRLARYMPARARTELNDALREQGMAFDITALDPEDVDELIDALSDTSVDITQPGQDVTVRIYGE
jgi:hypothetical protein